VSKGKEGGVSLPLDPEVRRDASFYTWSFDYELVWADFTRGEEPRFRVYRNGEMRIHARKSLDSDFEVLRYTDDLESFGIKTDADLREWEAKGAEYFEWDNNPWFEVVSVLAGDEDFHDVCHDLHDAVRFAEELWSRYGQDGNIWED
jgi:hypothetical protein